VIASAERRTTAPKFLIAGQIAGTRRFTVEEYHQFGDAGILTPDSRVELIDGWIVEKPVQKPPHAIVMTRLTKRLPRLIPQSFEVRLQLPITLPTSEPEPDAVVARGPEERYGACHPGPNDIALLIEVSHTTLAMDQGPKKLLYAAAKLPIYWVINIPDDRIEIYTSPRAGRKPTYRTRADFRRGSKIPLIVNGKTVAEIAVNDLLPDR
jgi:Uma2 family endonuclease